MTDQEMMECSTPEMQVERLKAIMHRLRAPGGCPWDAEQTHESLVPCLIEEAYEVVDAIKREDHPHLEEELGDLLLQVVFHCELAQEAGRYDMNDVARGISEKLIRRHPHVFGDSVVTDTDGVLSLSTAIDDVELQEQAKTMFTAVAERLDYVGVLALEFFDVQGALLVNEIAPRVHNSGHWTQQGAETCQFENHLRAVCGMPLGSTKLIRPTAMINILGEDTLPNAILAQAGCHVHWYGKEKRAGRKMGHINVSADYNAELQRTLCGLAKILDKRAYPAIHDFAAQMQ